MQAVVTLVGLVGAAAAQQAALSTAAPFADSSPTATPSSTADVAGPPVSDDTTGTIVGLSLASVALAGMAGFVFLRTRKTGGGLPTVEGVKQWAGGAAASLTDSARKATARVSATLGALAGAGTSSEQDEGVGDDAGGDYAPLMASDYEYVQPQNPFVPATVAVPVRAEPLPAASYAAAPAPAPTRPPPTAAMLRPQKSWYGEEELEAGAAAAVATAAPPAAAPGRAAVYMPAVWDEDA